MRKQEARRRQGTGMRAGMIGLVLGAMLLATQAAAYDAYDRANCNGADWDTEHALVVSKVMASPRVNLVKSPHDDDFKAESCPAATEACRKKSYLVTGDLMLTGRTRGEFTCVSHQSPQACSHRQYRSRSHAGQGHHRLFERRLAS